MKVSPQEHRAILETIKHGEAFGFGNLICHLQTAWAAMLMERYGLDEEAARAATARDGSGYPFKMFDDICKRGEWDETGKKYRSAHNPLRCHADGSITTAGNSEGI